MKRFRFSADGYLKFLEQQADAVNAAAAALQARQGTLRADADARLQQRADALAPPPPGRPVAGAQLAALDRWRNQLTQDAAAARREADSLDDEIAAVTLKAVELRHKVRLLEKLRERRRQEHQRDEDREEQSTADELHAARHQSRL